MSVSGAKSIDPTPGSAARMPPSLTNSDRSTATGPAAATPAAAAAAAAAGAAFEALNGPGPGGSLGANSGDSKRLGVTVIQRANDTSDPKAAGGKDPQATADRTSAGGDNGDPVGRTPPATATASAAGAPKPAGAPDDSIDAEIDTAKVPKGKGWFDCSQGCKKCAWIVAAVVSFLFCAGGVLSALNIIPNYLGGVVGASVVGGVAGLLFIGSLYKLYAMPRVKSPREAEGIESDAEEELDPETNFETKAAVVATATAGTASSVDEKGTKKSN